jgi:anthranilate synthase component I
MRAPFDISADLDTPVSAFLKLAPLTPRFLLESVVGGEQVARYSFIGFGRQNTWRIEHGELCIDGVAQPAPTTAGELLDAWRLALAAAPRPLPEVPELPFQGGLVGVTSYDVVRRFERVPEENPVGDDLQAAYVATSSLLVFDHATRTCAVLHAGSESERVALRRDVIMALRGGIPPSEQGRGGFRMGGFSSPVHSLSKEAFEDGVRRVREHIVEGDVYQLVLSSRFSGACTLDAFQVYRALRLLNPSPYMYFFQVEGLSVVGSSPEALVRLAGRKATLRPIAGTRPRGRDRAADLAHEEALLADPKEAAEHVMLVDLARNDLGRVAVPSSIHVEPYRIIERYSHVMHIVSGVQGDLEPQYDQFDLFAAVFPAGTVVGAPKVRAMELIEELEPVRRGPYAGTVGYFGHDDRMDQAIAIRTVWFEEGRYAYQAGAGVVADSVPEREHDEIIAKSAAIAAAMALAEEGL